MENQDLFLHLHNSYLLIEGHVLKADDTRYVDADLSVLTNNGLLYLISCLKITLAGQMVELSIILATLYHFLVWRAIHQHIPKDVDWHKIGFQISTPMQLLIILDFIHDRGT